MATYLCRFARYLLVLHIAFVAHKQLARPLIGKAGEGDVSSEIRGGGQVSYELTGSPRSASLPRA